MECRACQKAVTGLICDACGAIAPPRPLDRFTALGVPRRYSLSQAELETRYRELSRKLHPDRFALAAREERMLSLQAATTLNDAYRTLKAPLRRAEYLLELEGLKIRENEAVAPDFLVEVMELREALADAADGGAALLADVKARHAREMARLGEAFEAWERSGDRDRLAEAKDALIKIRYYQRFLDEHEGRGEELS